MSSSPLTTNIISARVLYFFVNTNFRLSSSRNISRQKQSALPFLMNRIYERLTGQHPEITKLDARIIKEGGTSSTADMLPCNLQKAKAAKTSSKYDYTKELILENGYLRQEIVYYKESREAMLAFHNSTLKSFNLLQTALKDLSHKMAMSEEIMLRYWGIDVKNVKEDDLVMF